MGALTGAANRAVLDAYDFGRFDTVVDVGGGNGTLLAAVLAAYPNVRGVLFDQPQMVEAAGEILAPVADRTSVVSGSFFESVPEGGDAYILKWIIHDWENPEAIAILRVCRAALHDDASVLVIERDLGTPNAEPEPKFADLNMLVNPGGRERTREAYATLFEDAGLRLEASTPAGHLVIYEARAA
jgi:hypothetical protein